MTHAHAVRPHPAHWFQAHPTVTALLLAALIVLVLIGLASMIGTNIQTETLSN